jgi:hypothetical protein
MTLVLDDTSYVYTGNQIQPAVTVLDENKEELSSDNYYVKYDCNVDIGTGTVTVTGTGNYKGELTGTFYIVPGDGKIVSLANGKTGITIRWDSVPGATGYRVYRKTYSGSWIRIAVLSGNDALSYVDTGAASGTIYYYIVRPEASNILGGFANYMKIQRLAQPVFSRANTATGINISWSAVKGAKGYKIYRKVNNQTGWTLIKTVSASTLYYNDTAVTTGNKYTYTVKAYSGSYNSSWHKGAVMYRHAGRNIYYAKSPKAGQLFLKWYGDNKVTGYQVSYSTDSTFSSFKYVTVKGNSINYKTLTGLSKGKYYYVKVRSYRVVDGVTYCSNWGAVKKIYISK